MVGRLVEVIAKVPAEFLTAESDVVGTGDNAATVGGTAVGFEVVCRLSVVLVGTRLRSRSKVVSLKMFRCIHRCCRKISSSQGNS